MHDLAGIRERNALTYKVGPFYSVRPPQERELDRVEYSVESTVFSITGNFICHCRSPAHAKVIALLLTEASRAAVVDNRELFPEEKELSDEV